MNVRILLTIVSLLLHLPLLSNQPERLTFRHISQANGFPNNHITELYKDSRGFLWIGSSAGLFRYDGYTTRRVANMVGRKTGVLTEQILSILEDSTGKLWVQSESSHAIYDPETNILYDWISDYIQRFGISGYVTATLSDTKGNIWLAIQDKGIYRLDIENNKADKSSGISLSDISICSLTMNDGKIVGVTSSGSIIETDPSTMKTRLLSMPPDDVETESSHYVAYADQSRRLWISNNNRVLLYDLESATWKNDLLPSNGFIGVVKEIYNDSKGNLWISRDHHGIEKLEFKDGKYRISPVLTEGDFIPQSTVSSFLEDEYGTLLLGTYKLGLYSHNERVNKFHTEGFPNIDKMPDVNCMVAAKDGSVWIGTDNSGTWRWHPASNQIELIHDSTEDAPSAITCITSSPEGKIYIGKFAKGLFCIANGQVKRLDTGSEIDRSYVWSMNFDKEGNLWIGTLGNGLFKYDTIRHTTEQYTTRNSELKSDYITTVMPAKDNNVYAGSSGGVVRYDPTERKLTPVRIDENQTLSESKIMQILEDSRGLIWIASTSGLKILDRKNGKIQDININGAQHESDVLGIIEDNSGSIWAGNGSKLTNLKVNYDDRTGKIEVNKREYDSLSGLPNCDFNQRSFASLTDGNIALGNPFGIIHFNPNDIPMNSSRPNVIFTDLYIGDKPVNVGEKVSGHEVLKKAIFSGKQIELSHNTKEFTIFFTSDNYALPEKTKFKYQLEGYSEQWTECPEGINYVSYTNLSPGSYRLHVIAINEDGFESESPATLDIKIHPSFWGTPWAWIIYAVFIAVCIWLIVRIARNRERRILEQRNLKENQRKQEELNQLKFRFFTNVSHDLRTPLTLIVSPLEDMIKESTDARQSKRLNQMRNNAMRLLSLVNQLLDFRKSEEADLQMSPSEGDIVAFARNVCHSFISLSDRKNINLTFYSDQERIELLFDEDKMEKIFMNLLGNAFKFTPAGGRIDVAIEHSAEDSSKLRIQVSDTGIGIKDKDKKHIFERFYQVDDDGDSHPETGSGIGLSMVSEYVRLHDGTIRVTDNVERGSVFIIEIPIRHAATKQEKLPAKTRDISEGISSPDTPAVSQDTTSDKSDKKAVLIVDDSSDMTEMLKDSLENAYNILTAADGKEALKIAKATKPDIILTDLMMP
ncbi:MAG: response regulator, partial [Muribaculaceae bacterium]|nr:response regulator [Muribaculaceae bacterium]